jgi:hypothetical protein
MDNSLSVEIVNTGEHIAHKTSSTILSEYVALILSRGQQFIELSAPETVRGQQSREERKRRGRERGGESRRERYRHRSVTK